MNNSIKNNNTFIPNIGGVGTPPYGANLTQLQVRKRNLTEMNLFTHSPIHLFPLKRAAFTLAEVLITLGIIGVVAALTLPMLIANYQKQVTVTKLQKAYTTLNQAFRQSEIDNGSSEFWQETDEISVDEYFNRYWKKYFNEPVYCKTAKECGYSSANPYKKLNGSTSQTIGISRPRVFFKTSDDVFYLFIGHTTNEKGERVSVNYVFIDINGAKAPNTYGVDVFRFDRVAGKGILPYGNNATLAANIANCSLNASGEYCAARIMKEGWKINYSFK